MSVERKELMTQREFFTAVIASEVSEELKTFATESIAKLDARNAKRAKTLSKTQKENVPLIAKIATLLTSEPKLASELAKEMEISTPKATALVKKVEGVKVCDVKVKGKGTQKGYFLA
jgi:methylphosphotriester-DNA--protein-cysteine methyltransferase